VCHVEKFAVGFFFILGKNKSHGGGGLNCLVLNQEENCSLAWWELERYFTLLELEPKLFIYAPNCGRIIAAVRFSETTSASSKLFFGAAINLENLPLLLINFFHRTFQTFLTHKNKYNKNYDDYKSAKMIRFFLLQADAKCAFEMLADKKRVQNNLILDLLLLKNWVNA